MVIISEKIDNWRDAFVYLQKELVKELVEQAQVDSHPESERIVNGITTAFSNLKSHISEN